jgi:phospholipid/cholesterol/gamma-HCH transport system substrate-binding protein
VTDASPGQTRVVKPPRRFQGRLGPVRAGTIALVIVLVATFLAFSKELPWQQPFEIKGVFESASSIRLDSPVRIAGVEVGQVTKVEHLDDSDLAVVTMEIEENGRPIHTDATLKIRPRLFLEGNFFIDMTAGTPETDELEDGDTIPVTQTAYPVQLDQVLTSLQSDSRKGLQNLLEGFGTGLTYKPTPADDLTQDPDVKGEPAMQALNDSLAHAGPAFKNAARVNKAFLGTQPRDLRKLIAGLQKTAAGLAQNEERLKSFFTNFNRTMIAFAAEQTNLRRAIRLLGPTLERANSYFTNFAEALPPTRQFVRAFIPSVRETPATIDAAGPFLTQFTALASREELGGLLSDLRPMTASFAKVVFESIDFNRQTDLTSRCFAEVVLPAGDVVLQDGSATTGVPNFKEFWYSVVGLAGESQNFDGNGQYTRVQTGGGPFVVKSGTLPGRSPLDNQLFGNAILPPLGTRPTHPDRLPPHKPDVPCHTNPVPDLNGPAARPGPPDAAVTNP